MWQHLVVLNCIILFIVVKSFTVVGTTHKCSRAESKQVFKKQMYAEVKNGAIWNACVNLVEVLSGTHSHLFNSLVLVFWAVRI